MDERRRGNRIGSCVIGSVRLSFVFLIVFFFLVVAVVLRCFFFIGWKRRCRPLVGPFDGNRVEIGSESGWKRVWFFFADRLFSDFDFYRPITVSFFLFYRFNEGFMDFHWGTLFLPFFLNFSEPTFDKNI